MFMMTTKGGGMATSFPDTCKTPTPGGPVPIPYPNIAMLPQANPGTMSKKVTVLNQAAGMLNSIVTMSSGDEAGAAGGVVSGQIKGPMAFKRGSAAVKIEGQAAVHHLSMTAHNGNNANISVGLQTTPSQTKVIIMR